MSDNENKVLEIFEKLQKRNLIASSTKLKRIATSAEWCPPIKTSICGSTIEYTSKLLKLEKIEIGFCLLHEEGHLRERQTGLWIFLFGFLVGIIPLVDYIYKISILHEYDPFVGLIEGAFFLIVFYVFGRFSFWDDEFASDDFASKILKYECKKSNPSKIVGVVLDKLPSFFPPKFDYHPPKCQRVKKISDTYDS